MKVSVELLGEPSVCVGMFKQRKFTPQYRLIIYVNDIGYKGVNTQFCMSHRYFKIIISSDLIW